LGKELLATEKRKDKLPKKRIWQKKKIIKKSCQKKQNLAEEKIIKKFCQKKHTGSRKQQVKYVDC
jgi:hypothetical protein